MQTQEKQVPIWFFIGALLTVYGAIIAGAGVYGWVHPPEKKVALWDLHADVWWGALLCLFGLAYGLKFWPRQGEGLTGKIDSPPARTRPSVAPGQKA
jgi:hypothetical protein